MKEINTNVPVVCRQSIKINSSADRVWSVLTNLMKWPEWQKDIKSIQVFGVIKPDSTFIWKSGGTKIKSKFHTVHKNKQLGWTGRTMGIYAIHNWEINEKNGKTEVLVSENMEGFLARIFKKVLNNSLENSMNNWLEYLKIECEK